MKFYELSKKELSIIESEITEVLQYNNLDAESITAFWDVLALGIEANYRR